jgi:hypothetical protein
MKNIGLFSGELEFNTDKLQDQLNAISMAAGALAHNLREIDATHAAGETGTYTKAMVDPDPVSHEVERGDIVMIRQAIDKDGVSGSYARVLSNHREHGQRLELELSKGRNYVEAYLRDVDLIAKAVK